MSISFFPDSEKSENGIFQYLARKLSLDSIVTTFGTEHIFDHVSSNILNLDPTKFYGNSDRTLNQERQYVGLEFHSYKFIPFAYTLSQYQGEGHILETYDLEASTTDNSTDNWEVIDSQSNNDFCSVGLLPTFYIKQEFWKPFVRFRIVRTGIDCTDQTYLRVGGIELFGQLEGYLINRISKCKCHINIITTVFLYILFEKE